jgi:CzcA family heavy metal efflux pump
MLRQAIRWSLRRPHLVAWACVWLLVLGVLLVDGLKIDLLPNVTPVQVTIQTEAPGLVAEQVEETVTDPIESALLGAAGLAGVDSRSVQGLSVITARFQPDIDPVRARQSLTENLARVGSLPPGVSGPRLSPPVAPGPSVLTVGFTSDKLSPMDLRDLVQWTVRPRLLSSRGVANVAIYGGQIRRIEVRARPGDLADSDLGFLDIVAATRRATSVAGAGFIDTPNQRVLIEPHGQADTLDEVRDGQIQTPGNVPVRIDDVADVVEAPAPAFGDALIDGRPGVLVVVDRALGANMVDTTREVEASLAQLGPALAAQGVKVRTDLNRPASFISDVARGIVRDLLIASGLVALALALFMRDLRVVLVTLAAAPLTLLACLAALKVSGWTLNAMTLGGLAVALGLVIDDAVIDVESIVSELRDAESRHGSRLEAILAASLEIRSPVLYATLALVLSLVPLLLLGGSERAFLTPLATIVMVAALTSLLVALVVTPALAFLFLRHIRAAREPALIQRIKAGHSRWLGAASARGRLLLLATGMAAGIAAVALLSFRAELLPSVHDDHLVIATDAPASTSLGAVRATGASVAADLASLPGVRAVSQRIGRDASSTDGAGIEHSVFDVALAPTLGDGAQAALARRVQTLLSGHPDASAIVRSRFDASQLQGAGQSSLQINVLGQDLDAVDQTATRVRAVLGALAGPPTVSSPAETEAPAVRVDLNFNRLALDGLSASDVLDTIQAAFAGETVAHLYEGPRVVDLAVSAQADLRRDPEAVGNLLLRSTSGFAAPLRSIANVYLTNGRAVISHQNGVRRELVAAVPKSGDIDRFAAAARAAIQRKVTLPPGVFLDFQVVNSAAKAIRNLAWAFALGLFGVVAFLSLAFDGRTAGLIFGSTLFGLVGGVAAVSLMGGVLSMGAMAGFVALVGLSMRSAIVLVSRAEDLALSPGAPWTLATMASAAGERLAPVAASAALVVLALAPFAADAGAAGREIIGPMSIVVISGVVTGALGNILILPIVMLLFWRPRARGDGDIAPSAPVA